MGLEQGNVSVLKLRIDEETEIEGWVETCVLLQERLDEHAFTGAWTSTSEKISGWVRPDDLMSVKFGEALNAWQMDPVLWLCLRVDDRKIQASVLRARLQTACRQWCEERGVRRCPTAVKKELKESIKAELLFNAQPRMTTFGMMVDLESRSVLVASSSESRLNELRRLLFRQFGWKFVEDSPYCWIDKPDPLVERLSSASDKLGSIFLLWLWQHPERSLDLQIDGGDRSVNWTVGDQLELVREDGERWTARKVAHLDTHTVARQGIAERYMPKSMNLELVVDDDEVYDFKIKAPGCQISGLKGQPSTKDFSDHEDPSMVAVWSRAAGLRTLYGALGALFEVFSQEVLSGEFSVERVRAIARGEEE